MDWLVALVPWWVWIIIAAPFALLALRFFGAGGALAVIGAGLSAVLYARGHRDGTIIEREKQRTADDAARTIIHEKKEDVRAIPDTPAGKAQRDERFNEWQK